MSNDQKQDVIILKVKQMKLTRHESGVWMTKPNQTASMMLAKHIAELLEGKLPVAESTLGMAISPLVNQLLDAAAGIKEDELPGVDVDTLPIVDEDPTE